MWLLIYALGPKAFSRPNIARPKNDSNMPRIHFSYLLDDGSLEALFVYYLLCPRKCSLSKSRDPLLSGKENAAY